MTTDPIRARIAAVQWTHRAGEFTEFCRIPYRAGHRCGCGKRFSTLHEHNAHVADVVAEALALQQEQETEAVTAIRALHRLNTSAFSGKDRCLADGFAYPCPTLAILEGHGLLGAEQP